MKIKLNAKFLSYTFIVIIYFLSSLSLRAESVKDFQIEGISLGDSALKYYSKEEIKKSSRDHFKDKTFTATQNYPLDFFKNYDYFDYTFRTNDKNFIIVSMAGIISYESKKMNDCYKKMKKIDDDVKSILENMKRTEGHKIKSKSDETGISTFSQITFEGSDGVINITCYDNTSRENNMSYLSVSVRTNEFADFLRFKAYN